MQLLLCTPYRNVKSPYTVYSTASEQLMQYKFIFVSINNVIVVVFPSSKYFKKILTK